MSCALILARWLHFSTLIVLFGTLLFQYYCGIRSKFQNSYRKLPKYSAWLHMLLVVTSILVLLSSVAWLALEAGEMGDGPMDALHPEAILAVLSGTTFGHVWQFHLAASLALVIAIAMRPAGLHSNEVLLFLAALLLTSQSWVGHAIIERGM